MCKGTSNKASDPKIVDDFFEKVKEICAKNDIWERPEFNCDESGYQSDQGNLSFLIRMLLPYFFVY